MFLLKGNLGNFFLLVEKHLISSSTGSWTPSDRIVYLRFPDLLPLQPHIGIGQPGAPGPAQDGGCVVGMIPHEVERLLGLDPVLNGRDLPGVEIAVKVSGDEKVDLE